MKASRSDRERKTKGNTWAEQEDAFFGEDMGYCRPCTTDKDNSKRSASTRTSLESGQGNSSKQRKNRIARLAGNASSKISDFVSKAKGTASNYPAAAALRRRSQEQPKPKPMSPAPSSHLPSRNVSKPHPSSSRGSSPSRPQHLPSFSTPKNNGNTFQNVLQTIVNETLPLPCAHCHAIPLMFNTHPFFGPSQRICHTHPSSSIVRCVSCHRFQPKNAPYARIGTSTARICPACAQTAILDNGAAERIYMGVLEFMQMHGLDLYGGKMRTIPIVLVGEDAMNQSSVETGCGANAQHFGMCIWDEQHMILPLADIASSAVDVAVSALRRIGVGNDGGGGGTRGDDEVRRNRRAGSRNVRIRQILCLKGLPETLMASVLAHEATHAWFGLNPIRRDGIVGEECSVGVVRRIDQTVEEGTCQLVAYLYLDHIIGQQTTTTKDGNGSGGRRSNRLFGGGGAQSEQDKLNQYYKWMIENHSSPVYGGGFKQATKAYLQTVESGGGLKELLQYISIHRAFPPL